MADFRLLTPGGLELTALDFSEVTPGTSYKAQTGGALQIQVENISGVAKVSRKIIAAERAPYLTYQQIRFSLDDVTYATTELVLGEFAVGQAKTLYLDLIVPAGAPGGTNQRADLNIIAS